jgi:anti-sigma B factor antagonist
VSQERSSVVWLGSAAVLTLPVEIDISNADQVRDDLLSVLNRGAATLVVDMAGTTFCDSAGVNALVRAHKRATANGSNMHLVVGAPAVRRVLAITGVDHLIAVYPSVTASLAAGMRGPDEEAQHAGPAGSPDPGGPRRDPAHPDPDDWAAQPG